jgi:hypothetical protein
MKIEGKIWRHKQWIDDPITEVKKARVWSANDLPAATVIKELKLKGIYALEVPSLKCIYIGQSKNIQSRWSQHRYVLNKGTCEVRELQECWNSNKDLFEFKVLEITDSNLLEKERAFAEQYVEKGYTLFNNYFHVTPKNIIIEEQHIPLITKLLRLITKGRLSPLELDRYLDTL